MDDHEHCITCFDTTCIIEVCRVISCPLNCGAMLHECKVVEHKANICPREQMPCINSYYGCPQVLSRAKMPTHLVQCPASVVTCSLEWNRRSSDEVQRSFCELTDHHYNSNTEHILDVALAKRDQRLFIQALHMPTQLRRALRNSYTSFPAVPFSQRPNSIPQRSDLEMEDSTESLDFDTMPDHHCELKGPPGFSYTAVHCSLCKKRQTEEAGLAQSITDAISRVKDAVENKSATDKTEELTRESSTSKAILNKTKPQTKNCDLDLVMEMFNSFRSKPRKMLTFLCAQDFRRDEYSSHYKNVHTEIQAGLDGWFQVRCPLATYGCPYTYQRFKAANGDRIIFNSTVESYGLTSGDNAVYKMNGGEDHLNSLPDEVILHIISYLDSFSLKNLSMASKHLRHICEHILPMRGMVIFDWKKQGAKNWVIAQTVWSFSTVFKEVPRWSFAEVESVSNHLATCPYNVKREYQEKKILAYVKANDIQG